MNRVIILLIAGVVYLGLSYVTFPISYVTLPVEMLCTFLHEFGHAFFALITGGHVHSLQVNPDGSGVTTTSGGSNALITMGGYVGSAIFGNLLLRFTTSSRSKIAMTCLSIIMVVSSLIWFATPFTTVMLIAFAVALFIIAKTPISSFVMSFLGIASMVYIIQDFNVGPSSDLKAYESYVGIFPASIWMYIWLGIVIGITFFNVIHLLKSDFAKEKDPKVL